jgi:hypothetical protein
MPPREGEPMAFAYIVRCNFTEPAREQAWNDWYSGPKIAQMLRKPGFLSCQRFRRAAGTGRDYLALWMVRSQQAFMTQQYTTDWGFFDWERYVTDWSRDLFDAGDADVDDLAVPMQGALQVVSFDGMTADQASTVRATLSDRPALRWMPIAGLDRHTPMIGVAGLTDVRTPDLPDVNGGQSAIYRPISTFARAA